MDKKNPLPEFDFKTVHNIFSANQVGGQFFEGHNVCLIEDVHWRHYDRRQQFNFSYRCPHMIYIRRGTAGVELNKNVRSLQEGDILALPACSEAFWHDMSEDLSFFMLLFKPQPSGIFTPVVLDRGAILKCNIAEDDRPLLEGYIELLKKIVVRDKLFDDSLQLLVGSFFEFVDGYCLLGHRHRKVGSSHLNSLFNEFLVLVKDNCIEERNIPFYASKLNISANYLSEVVKEVSEQTPKEWIDRTLISKAQQKLVTSNESVEEIASALGFSSPAFFNRFFKRHTGVTPGHYRKQ